MSSAGWMDISTPLANGMAHWPGDPDPVIRRDWLALHPHTGTHVDAPLHYIPGGATIDRMPPELLIGPARVANYPDMPPAERLLLRGAPAAGITLPQAEALLAAGTRTVGIDTLTIGDDDVHRLLLGAGVCVLEVLDLRGVEPGEYELVCLPLKVTGGDGAPARALLRRRGA